MDVEDGKIARTEVLDLLGQFLSLTGELPQPCPTSASGHLIVPLLPHMAGSKTFANLGNVRTRLNESIQNSPYLKLARNENGVMSSDNVHGENAQARHHNDPSQRSAALPRAYGTHVALGFGFQPDGGTSARQNSLAAPGGFMKTVHQAMHPNDLNHLASEKVKDETFIKAETVAPDVTLWRGDLQYHPLTRLIWKLRSQMMKDRVRSDKLEIWSCAKLPARIPAVRHLYDENMTFFKTIESVILKYGYLTDFEISLLVENMGFRNANISRWLTQQGYWIFLETGRSWPHGFDSILTADWLANRHDNDWDGSTIAVLH